MKKQILKNLFSNYLGTFLGMLLGFLLIPFLVNKLGSEAFGISVLAESIIVLFQVFAFSIRVALSRHATVMLSQGNRKEFIEYLSTGRYILNILAVIVFGIGALVSFVFPKIFTVPAELNYQSQILFFWIVLAFSISIPNVVYWSVLYANQRFDLINYSNFGGVILRAVFIFVLFTILPPSGVNLVTYGAAYFLMTWVQNHIIFLWHKTTMPGLQIKISARNPGKMKEILSFGGYSSISGLSAVIYESVMNIVINIYMGPSFNTMYAISSKIPSVLKRLFLTPATSLAPSFTALVARNDKRRLKLLFLFYSKAITVIVLPIALLIAAFSREIVLAWVGEEFLLAAHVMPLFLLASVFTIPASVCAGVNNAYGEIKFPTMVTLFSTLVSVLLGLYLGFEIELGLQGIAAAAILINVLNFSIFMPMYCCRQAAIPPSEYFIETLIKPLLLILPTWGVLNAAFVAYKEVWTVYMIALAIVIVVPIYAVMAYKILVNQEEKWALRDLAGQLVEKLNLKGS